MAREHLSGVDFRSRLASSFVNIPCGEEYFVIDFEKVGMILMGLFQYANVFKSKFQFKIFDLSYTFVITS
jgi:hypothetical protein